jgi:hypothetical protein
MIRVLICLLFSATAAFAVGMVYVVNSLDESLGWIDLTVGSFESDPHAATLGYIPNDVVASRDYLYVVNSGDNNVQVIDRHTFETMSVIELGEAVNPWAAATLDDGRLAVTATLSGTLSIVNPQLGTVDTTFYVGTAPQYVYELYDQIYVLCTGVEFPIFNPGVLKRYSSETLTLVDSVVVGVNPQSATFVWVGYFNAHVLCTGNYDDIDGSLYVVSLESTMALDTIVHVGGSPGAVAAQNGTGWIAAGGWDTEGYLYRYNPYTYEFLNGFDNPIITGVGTTDVVQQGYVGGGIAVSCFGNGTVEYRDTYGDLQITFPMSAGASALDIWIHSDTDVPEPDVPISLGLELISAYPNPFNGVLNFKLESALYAPNLVEIYDVLGQQVGAIPVGEGETEVSWLPGAQNGKEVSAGIYFARLKNGVNAQPIRVVYLK